MIVCMTLGSCHRAPNETESFLIKVDRIQAPISVNAGSPFDIEFFGTIGSNGCFSFGEFIQNSANNEITIEALGKVDTKARVCPAVMVYLDGYKLNMSLSTPGNYLIRIKQPDNTFIEQNITVN